MKKIFLLQLFIAFSVVLFAQQLPQYSNYMINDFALNPAVAGTNPYFEGKSNNRYQWVGLTDAPRTYVLSVNGPMKFANMGIGGMLFTDIVGPTRRTGFYLSYSYQIKVAEKVKASLGLSAGVLQFLVDGSKISLYDQNDLALSNGVQSVVMPDFGAGIYVYETNKKWFAGFSAPQLFQNKIKFFDYSTSSLSKLASHYYVTGGYKFDLNDDFKLEPSACLKYVKPAPFQFDLGLRAIYRNKIWLGATFRYLDAVSALLGFTYQENLTVAYSYDFTTTAIRKYSRGTHEIMIGLKFHKSKTKE
jgi:type IX secretion system PorP/SprF family membrane protein